MRRISCGRSAPPLSSRSYVRIKSVVEYRIHNFFPKKTGKEFLAEQRAKVEKDKHPNPKNKKEELSFCLKRPNYEYVSVLQATANDLMCVTDSPQDYVTDLAYKYPKMVKLLNYSKNNNLQTSAQSQIVKIHPL